MLQTPNLDKYVCASKGVTSTVQVYVAQVSLRNSDPEAEVWQKCGSKFASGVARALQECGSSVVAEV